MLISWLRPKRYRPDLVDGSFWRAFVAHLLSIILAGILVALAYLWDELGRTVDLAEIHRGLATMTLEAAQETAQPTVSIAGASWNQSDILLIIGGTPVAFELALLLLGGLLMPYAACGDGASSAWKRSVKNVYWSTTALVPAVVACATLLLAARWNTLASVSGFIPCEPRGTMGWILVPVAAILMLAVTALFFRALVVGAHRQGRQVAEPAVSAQTARCEDCGYLLRGLSTETKCPECGLAVGESLEGGRRKTNAWQQRERESRGFVELIYMQWAVLHGSAVFREIPVQRGIGAARHFWWGTWILMVVCLLAILRGAAAYTDQYAELRLAMSPISVGVILLPISLQFGMTLVACLWAHMRYGIRDHRISTLVCYYASPLMWPVMLVIVAAAIVATESLTPSLGKSLPTALGIAGALTAAALAFWWMRLLKALRIVRFANV